MPVLSVALVLYSNEDQRTPAISFQRVTETVLGQELTLVEYWQIAVRDLDAAGFLEAVPTLAAGFAALMRIPKRDRVRVKAALLDRLRQSDLDEARRFLLLNLIESYLTLDDQETVSLRTELLARGGTELGATIETWTERMMARGAERGREQGIEQGALQGERALVLRMVGARFGAVPEAVRRSIETADRQTVEHLAERLVQVPSIEEFIEQLP